jgi:hypothetical protein
MPFPLEDQYIDAVGAALGWMMPVGLRERLRRNNGGEVVFEGYPGDPVWWLLPVRDDSDRKRLSRTAHDLVTETNAARSDDGFPPGAVVVAENGTGDLVVVLAGQSAPQWWDHETGETAPVTTEWSEPQ